jgi:5-hydroxyisourate hydrolase
MSHLTTHVLDASRGEPAAHVAVALARHVPPGSDADGGVRAGGLENLAEGLTGADGRLAIGPDELAPGMYQLSFGTGAYFADRGVETFYPLAVITFTITADAQHTHVPLLLSPFAYSTYRGS